MKDSTLISFFIVTWIALVAVFWITCYNSHQISQIVQPVDTISVQKPLEITIKYVYSHDQDTISKNEQERNDRNKPAKNSK